MVTGPCGALSAAACGDRSDIILGVAPCRSTWRQLAIYSSGEVVCVSVKRKTTAPVARTGHGCDHVQPVRVRRRRTGRRRTVSSVSTEAVQQQSDAIEAEDGEEHDEAGFGTLRGAWRPGATSASGTECPFRTFPTMSDGRTCMGVRMDVASAGRLRERHTTRVDALHGMKETVAPIVHVNWWDKVAVATADGRVHIVDAPEESGSAVVPLATVWASPRPGPPHLLDIKTMWSSKTSLWIIRVYATGKRAHRIELTQHTFGMAQGRVVEKARREAKWQGPTEEVQMRKICGYRGGPWFIAVDGSGGNAIHMSVVASAENNRSGEPVVAFGHGEALFVKTKSGLDGGLATGERITATSMLAPISCVTWDAVETGRSPRRLVVGCVNGRVVVVRWDPHAGAADATRHFERVFLVENGLAACCLYPIVLRPKGEYEFLVQGLAEEEVEGQHNVQQQDLYFIGAVSSQSQGPVKRSHVSFLCSMDPYRSPQCVVSYVTKDKAEYGLDDKPSPLAHHAPHKASGACLFPPAIGFHEKLGDIGELRQLIFFPSWPHSVCLVSGRTVEFLSISRIVQAFASRVCMQRVVCGAGSIVASAEPSLRVQPPRTAKTSWRFPFEPWLRMLSGRVGMVSNISFSQLETAQLTRRETGKIPQQMARVSFKRYLKGWMPSVETGCASPSSVCAALCVRWEECRRCGASQ